jgi:hypothetical protein
VSEAAPEGGRPRGGGLSRPVGPLPLWGWAALAAAGLGAYVFIRMRSASSGSTSTSEDVTAAGTTADDTTSTSEYEQVSSQLTGIEGTDEALLAAIKDLQGDSTTAAKVKVPDIVGDRGSAARAKISASGLKYKQDPETTPAGHETRVTSQTPHAGDEVARGSEVTAHVKVDTTSGKGSSGGGNSTGSADSSGGGSSGSSASSSARKPAAKKPASKAPATKAPTKAPAPKAPAAKKTTAKRVAPARRK